MNLEEAQAKLDAIPRGVDSAELSALSDEIAKMSMPVRQYRFQMIQALRHLARELDDRGASNLEYHVTLSRAGVDAVRILAQLENAERVALVESLAAESRVDIRGEILTIVAIDAPDESGMEWRHVRGSDGSQMEALS